MSQVFEITTQLALEDKEKGHVEITCETLSKGLLDEAELNACYQDVYILKIDGRKMALGTKLAKMLLGKIDVQYLADKTVSFEPGRAFRFSEARRRIMKKFGLSNLHYVGTKNKVTGIIFASKITKQEEHRNKFAEIYRAFKKAYPNLRFKPINCLTTNACSVEEQEFLTKLTTTE